MKLTFTTKEERDLYSDMQRKLWEHSVSFIFVTV